MFAGLPAKNHSDAELLRQMIIPPESKQAYQSSTFRLLHSRTTTDRASSSRRQAEACTLYACLKESSYPTPTRLTLRQAPRSCC